MNMCQICGKPIGRGRYCDDCKKMLTEEKTVTMPESQLIEANKLVDKINRLVKELKDCITITY